jgi:hypothetical protein
VVYPTASAQTENTAAMALADQSQEDPIMVSASTFLAPGQRYAPPGTPSWRLEPQVTVLQVIRDLDGSPRIVHRCREGSIVMTLATELEALVEAGRLVPISAAGQPEWC